MRKLRFVIVAILYASVFLTACAKHVYVHTPASPTVKLHSATVALVSADRGCQRLANELARRMTREALFQVDPKAEVRLLVSECREQVRPTVSIRQMVDSEKGILQEKRTIRVDGRAFAQVEVTSQSGTQAHLIGSADWTKQTQNPKAIKTLRKQLHALLADDLLEQVRPIPRIAQRRIFPNAQPNSQRALLTEAVSAEIRGDLTRAIELAAAAQKQAPNSRIAEYLDELNRRLP